MTFEHDDSDALIHFSSSNFDSSGKNYELKSLFKSKEWFRVTVCTYIYLMTGKGGAFNANIIQDPFVHNFICFILQIQFEMIFLVFCDLG